MGPSGRLYRPGGPTESSPRRKPWDRGPNPGPLSPEGAAEAPARSLSPLPGLGMLTPNTIPRLAPWATLCRRSAALVALRPLGQRLWAAALDRCGGPCEAAALNPVCRRLRSDYSTTRLLDSLIPNSNMPQRGINHFTQGVEGAQEGIGFDGAVGGRRGVGGNTQRAEHQFDPVKVEAIAYRDTGVHLALPEEKRYSLDALIGGLAAVSSRIFSSATPCWIR